MKKRFCLLLALVVLVLPLFAYADNCPVCAGAGYLNMPAFGTNEMVQVKCTACGGTNVQPTATPVPVQPISFLRLPDPGDYTDYDDQCSYAEEGLVVFQGVFYDIDSYIADLTSYTGLVITKEYVLDDGDIRYYQLNHPGLTGSLYQDTCHVALFYAAYDVIVLAVAPGGSVQLPTRTNVLPDPTHFAYGEDRIKSLYSEYVTFECEKGYDIEGYINLLRYEYGFDVEAVNRGVSADTTVYAMYNPDIDAPLFSTWHSSDVKKAKRQLEIRYDGESITLKLPEEGGLIQLPMRGEEVRGSTASVFTLPEPPSRGGCDVDKGENRCSYTFSKSYDLVPYLSDLIFEGFTVTNIEEKEGTTTFYLFKINYRAKRLQNNISHASVSYDSSAKKLTIETPFRSNLSLPKSGQPTPEPTEAPTPKPTGGGGGGGTPIIDHTEERCSICGGDGWRTCGSCFGRGTVGYGSDLRDCPNFNCRGGEVECWTCGGDGKK